MSTKNERPHWDASKALQAAFERGESIVHRFVDDIDVVGADVLAKIPRDRPYLILGNHQTVSDLFTFPYVLLREGLPHRTIAKSGLRKIKWLFDFEPWGAIWHDQSAKNRDAFKQHTQILAETFQARESLLCFSEGSRSFTTDEEPAEFKLAFSGVVFNACKYLEIPLEVICMTAKYKSIPELTFGTSRYEMVQNFLRNAGIAYWISPLKRHRGIARISISRPYSIQELAGNGSKHQQKEDFTENTHDIISEMFRKL
jgi:hypothetical protein